MNFKEALRVAKVDDEIVKQITNVAYPRTIDNPQQEEADFMAAALMKCEELLGFEKTAEVMFHRSCCKSGFRLANARQLAREHGEKPLKERLFLLGNLKWMGKPELTADGNIMTVAVGSNATKNMTCSCGRLGGCKPKSAAMPLSYCLCCAGHFRFHYEKALGLKLKVKQVVSSILNSNGREPCVFVYRVC